MRKLWLLTATLLAAGCSTSWVPDLSLPDFSSWFNSEYAIEVEEVGRANLCNSAGGEAVVTVVPNKASLQSWADGRGIKFEAANAKPLPETSYAIVEFGQRPHSGYGLAVSRQGGLKNGILLLKGTFFEPQPGRWASDEPTSPCVAVALPPRAYKDVRVLDQTGRVRAATEGGPGA